jgi:hypothetical protein
MQHEESTAATSEELLREILDVVTQLRNGHFSAHMSEAHTGVGGEIAKVFNQHLEFLEAYQSEHLRLMEETGVTGRLGGQMELPKGMPPWTGAWQHMAEATNRMVGNLTWTVREDAKTIADLAQGHKDARAFADGGIQGEFRMLRESIETLTGRTSRNSAR